MTKTSVVRLRGSARQRGRKSPPTSRWWPRRPARRAAPRPQAPSRAGGRCWMTCAARSSRNAATSSMRFDGGRKADALRRGPRRSTSAVQARQRQRQMRAALVVRHGMDFVDDDRADVRSIAREPSAVSRMYSDSGVVTRMWGGLRASAARSAASCRRCARPCGWARAGRPALPRARRISASGASRFRRTSLLSALSGET